MKKLVCKECGSKNVYREYATYSYAAINEGYDHEGSTGRTGNILCEDCGEYVDVIEIDE